MHERLNPAYAVDFAKQLEPYRLFFLEDALAPEDLEWFANIRATCTTPIAMGELFNHPRKWTPLITNRQIDFMRMHITQMGGGGYLYPNDKPGLGIDINEDLAAKHPCENKIVEGT